MSRNVRIKSPSIMIPAPIYDVQDMNQFRNVLRLYFNQIDNAVSQLSSVPETVTIMYSTSMTLDISLGSYFKIVATNGTAFTINAPTNSENGQTIIVEIKNSAGGALGAATWNTVFKMVAWTQPANGFSRAITFVYDGTNWRQVGTTVDVAN